MLSLICYKAQSVYLAMGSEMEIFFANACCSLVLGCMFAPQAWFDDDNCNGFTFHNTASHSMATKHCSKALVSDKSLPYVYLQRTTQRMLQRQQLPNHQLHKV